MTPGPIAWLPARYTYVRPVDAGGMGIVVVVHDTVLRRDVVLKAPLALDARLVELFRDEVALLARLNHPQIVALLDAGELPDGRPYFTMRLVGSLTLGDVATRLRAASTSDQWGSAAGWTLHRVVDAVRQVADAVAYAHARGVLHRDLKPANLLVGEFGEVEVIDWGIARVLAAEGPRMAAGTAGYMAQEVLSGPASLQGPGVDVYALGATLWALLTGAPPPAPRGHRPPVLAMPVGPRLPRALVRLVEACTAPEIEERPTAVALAEKLRAWADGSERRARAAQRLEETAPDVVASEQLGDRARALREEAERLLLAVPSWAPEAERFAAWDLQDEARVLELRAAEAEARRHAALDAALSLDRDFPEANAELGAWYLRELVEAERAGDTLRASGLAVRLERHDARAHAEWAASAGRVSLDTEPSGATVHAWRLVERRRRLILEDSGPLGTTPLVDARVPPGSLVLELSRPGYRPARYPVRVGRGERWRTERPGGGADPLPLVGEADLGPDDIYIPAGWFTAGGDADAADALERRQVWVDGFILRRHPVTTGEYADWLTARHLAGEETANAVPVGLAGPLVERQGDRFVAVGADLPVVNLTWRQAVRFATSNGWRLPHELEWEKAARGVDERRLPWGDHPEAAWANWAGSAPLTRGRVPVEAFPQDECLYGVRGLAGNVADWCWNCWDDLGVSPDGRLGVAPEPCDRSAVRAVRGGAYITRGALARSAVRMGLSPDQQLATVGFRLCRSIR